MRRALAPALLVVLAAACGGGGDGGAARPSPPARVLYLGDSIAYDAEPAVLAALGSAGVPVKSETILGFGLAREAYYDWRAKWRALVEAERPAAVVVFEGAFDVDHAYRDPGFIRDRYTSLLDEARAILTARGARVVWMSTPWQLRPGWDRTVALVDDLTVSWAHRHRHDVTLVDGRDVLGRSAVVDGVRIRKLDGIHVCQQGAELVARAVARALDVAPRGAWAEGRWREDARYRADLFAPATGCPPR